MNGESLDEISLSGRLRSQTVRDLVAMHPTQAPYIQWLAYTNQKLPTLMIFIALDNDRRDNVDEVIAGRRGGGVLSLMSDVVIHGSDEMRSWFAQYMKLMQQQIHIYAWVHVHVQVLGKSTVHVHVHVHVYG